MRVAVIGSRNPVYGFALAGVKDQFLVQSREEAREALNVCLRNESLAVVLIEEAFIDLASDPGLTGKREKSLYPIILPIPGDNPGAESAGLIHEESEQ